MLVVALALLAIAVALAALALWVGVAREREASARRTSSMEGALSDLRHELARVGELEEGRARHSGRELDLTQAAIGAQLNGLGRSVGEQMHQVSSELDRMRSVVDGLRDQGAAQHGQLVEGIRGTLLQSRELARTTAQLREALASPNVRGQWGERMAEDVLAGSGLRSGINYVRGRTLPGGTRPDFTFLLPQGRHLHMDVKFPVANYLRSLESASEVEAGDHQRRFLTDVRGRLKELSHRDYADPESTVGFILMFIPNEAVFGFIHQHDPGLLDEALRVRVVPCSPSTLFAVLAVIRQAVDSMAIQRASGELLDCMAQFEHQWGLFGSQLDKVEKHVGTLGNSIGELNGARRRQLERQLDRVDELRSRTGSDSVACPR